jgi:peptidoglycan/LPS O-acetylase OafA/YrhL
VVTGPNAVASAPGRLDRLTSLRFFAAMLVALHHTTRDLGELGLVTDFFATGTVGVSFFFALSGFILAWTIRADDTPARFYRRRFARVYPLHLVTWGVALALLFAWGYDVPLAVMAASLLLLQAWVPNQGVFFGVNPPSWSLSCEAFFYAIFPFLPLRRANRTWCLVLAFLPLVAALAVHVVLGYMYWATYVFPGWRAMEFVAGAALATYMLRSGWRPAVSLRTAVLVTVAALVVTMGVLPEVFGPSHGIEDGFMLPAWLLLIATACTADLAGRRGVLTSRSLLRLGEWSFAFYLTHLILLNVVDRAVDGIDEWSLLGRLAIDVGFLGLAIAVAAAAYYAVERPLERRLRGSAPRPEMSAA